MIDTREALSRTALLVQRDVFPILRREEIITGLTRQRVRLRADAANLASHGGQTALVSCAIAVAQTGAKLSLDVANVPLSGPQPPLSPGSGLADALRAHCALLLQPADLDNNAEVDITIALGDTQHLPQQGW